MMDLEPRAPKAEASSLLVSRYSRSPRVGFHATLETEYLRACCLLSGTRGDRALRGCRVRQRARGRHVPNLNGLTLSCAFTLAVHTRLAARSLAAAILASSGSGTWGGNLEKVSGVQCLQCRRGG